MPFAALNCPETGHLLAMDDAESECFVASYLTVSAAGVVATVVLKGAGSRDPMKELCEQVLKPLLNLSNDRQ
jgi:hypothetical protein